MDEFLQIKEEFDRNHGKKAVDVIEEAGLLEEFNKAGDEELPEEKIGEAVEVLEEY
ncbi:MAG: hypothetical protein MUP58_03140 [Candidatus Nanohaloarchaeota archaeon QJJ-9]|nr:hypothetical protein [Candidatus Nanohaloarchaeota archaeon QJJ-9]